MCISSKYFRWWRVSVFSRSTLFFFIIMNMGKGQRGNLMKLRQIFIDDGRNFGRSLDGTRNPNTLWTLSLISFPPFWCDYVIINKFDARCYSFQNSRTPTDRPPRAIWLNSALPFTTVISLLLIVIPLTASQTFLLSFFPSSSMLLLFFFFFSVKTHQHFDCSPSNLLRLSAWRVIKYENKIKKSFSFFISWFRPFPFLFYSHLNFSSAPFSVLVFCCCYCCCYRPRWEGSRDLGGQSAAVATRAEGEYNNNKEKIKNKIHAEP